jgi:hypothetical protein
MKIKLIAIFLLAVLISLFAFVYNSQQKEVVVPPIDAAPLIPESETPQKYETTLDISQTDFTGILRFSGITQEQKDELQLVDSKYILEIGGYAINGVHANSLVLEGTAVEEGTDISSLEGKCVSAKGTVSPESAEADYNGFTYDRVMLRDVVLSVTPLEACRNVIYPIQKPSGPNVGENDFKSVEIKGVIRRINRPAPDIAYDYVIDSTESIPGAMNMSGLDEPIKFSVVMPSDFDVYSKLEQTIGTQVHVRGYFQWGYAESQFFTIEEFID